ncbi:MAG: hypothetical protein ACOYT4_00035 [Nanoarchaeota archaeon]
MEKRSEIILKIFPLALFIITLFILSFLNYYITKDFVLIYALCLLAFFYLISIFERIWIEKFEEYIDEDEILNNMKMEYYYQTCNLLWIAGFGILIFGIFEVFNKSFIIFGLSILTASFAIWIFYYSFYIVKLIRRESLIESGGIL